MSEVWTCECNYMNRGPICTKCHRLAPASHCSSRPTEGIERQDAANEMCEAIAAFKPVCEKLASELIYALDVDGHICEYTEIKDAKECAAKFLQETLPGLLDTDRTTPA